MKKIVLLLVFAFLGIGSIWAQNLQYQDAGSKLGAILEVNVTGNRDVPVELIRGTHAIMTVKFKMNQTVKGYRLKSYYIIKDVVLPISNLFPSELTTPLQAGTDQTLTFDLDVKNSYPRFSFVLLLILESDEGEPIIAFTLKMKIVK